MKRFTWALPLAVFSCSLILAGCGGADTTGVGETDETTADGELRPGDIEDGHAEEGSIHTVKGEVEKIYDAHTIAISSDWELFQNDLIVVSEDTLPTDLQVDDYVEVTGEVRKVAWIEVEKEYDWLDFEPKVEAELEDVEGFLVANKLVVTEHDDDDE
ncbi:hypothetical protein [Thalassoroseus pseudoceratinae]|uniref:hypothetical protein n=1 Tax=Thalassoroseus pseudoceratinae TaxID=2713176 RepID=UPI00141E47CF|nr:hypothetical protein [Thalassoroseus pseudoceratinae]